VLYDKQVKEIVQIGRGTDACRGSAALGFALTDAEKCPAADAVNRNEGAFSDKRERLFLKGHGKEYVWTDRQEEAAGQKYRYGEDGTA